jgi:hypothetical protein
MNLLKKICFIVWFTSFHSFAISQRMNIGFNIGLPVFHVTEFEENYYSPSETSRVFMVNEPDADPLRYLFSAPMWGKMHTYAGFGMGITIRSDYKRFALRIAGQFQYAHSLIKLYHFSSGGEIAENKARFMVNTFSYNFPVLLSVDLKRINNSPFIIFGGSSGFHTYANERINWSTSYNGEPFHFMYGIHYNNKPWTNLCFGYGKKFADGSTGGEFYFLLRTRIDGNDDDFTINYSFVEFNLNVYVGQQFLKKKHPIFRGYE